jgi:hypothetical protein
MSSISRWATSYRFLSTSHAAAAGPVARATPASAFMSTVTAPGAYGYVDMGGWIGGQADYVMVPYADFNLLKFPDKAHAMEKIRDLTCLSDILPTGFHGAVTAKAGVGSTVYVAGAGPVGLAAAASARILGAAAVLIGDMNQERLAHAKSVGFEPIDLTRHDRLGELVADVLGTPEVDCAIDCVGFEAKAQGTGGKAVEAPAVVPNSLMEITRAAGAIGIPGLYVTDDPGAKEQAAKHGNLSLRLGLGWAKSHSLHTGQTPVLKYNRQLMQGDTLGQAADRQDRQFQGDWSGAGAGRLQELRCRRRKQVRHRFPRPTRQGGLRALPRGAPLPSLLRVHRSIVPKTRSQNLVVTPKFRFANL